MNTDTKGWVYCRPFGSACLDVLHLKEWLEATRRRLPIEVTVPFIPVEELLARIHFHVQTSISIGEAREVVLADASLRDHEMAELAPHCLLGGEAYRRWALLIGDAVKAGELKLLDFASKLPAILESTSPGAHGPSADEAPSAQTSETWKAKAWALADDIYDKNAMRGWGCDKDTVAGEIVKIFGPEQLDIRTSTGKPILKSYLIRHALGGWTEHFGKKAKKQAEVET